MTEAELKERTRQFALRVILLVGALPKTTEGRAQAVYRAPIIQKSPFHQGDAPLAGHNAPSRIPAIGKTASHSRDSLRSRRIAHGSDQPLLEARRLLPLSIGGEKRSGRAHSTFSTCILSPQSMRLRQVRDAVERISVQLIWRDPRPEH
jgi:hypothetical protein